MQACCDPNILGEFFENLSVHNTQIFENFHLALPPIIRNIWIIRPHLAGRPGQGPTVVYSGSLSLMDGSMLLTSSSAFHSSSAWGVIPVQPETEPGCILCL